MKAALTAMGLASLVWPASDALPRLDPERYCTHLETRLDLPQKPRQACLRDEEAARVEVTALWATAKAASREQCAGTQALAAFPSYASLLTCVQFAEGIVIRPANPR